jgi:hypothetical protein
VALDRSNRIALLNQINPDSRREPASMTISHVIDTTHASGPAGAQAG